MADNEKVLPPGPPDGPNVAGAVRIQGDPQAPALAEIGVAGLKIFSGYVNEEYLPELFSPKSLKIYRTMGDDSIVNAVLTAITLILRAVDWRVEPADNGKAGGNFSAQAELEAEFAQSLMDDMSHTWEDFISEAMSMLSYGWAYHEIVLKNRIGPDEADPSRRSKYNDGRIGVRKLPIRSQDTLLRWEVQKDGGVLGMIQVAPEGGQELLIPIERALLIRTTSRKNSPEGVSILRSAYRPWFLKRGVEDMEAIGIERELAGLPVVSIPQKYLAAGASPEDKAFAQTAQKMARDVKFNQQGGVVIPSETFANNDGTLSAVRKVSIELLTTGGRRAIETGPVVERYNRDIARAALADFLTLGDAKGSYALSKNKSELFLRACETYLNQVAAVMNRFLLPRIFSYNGIAHELIPTMKPGRVSPVDLAELGAYIQSLAAAGAPLFPNQELSNYLADVAGMPEPPEDIGLLATPGQKPGPGQIDPNTGKPIQPKIDPATGMLQHEVDRQAEQDAQQAQDNASNFMSDNTGAAASKGGQGAGPFDKFNPNHDQQGRFTYSAGIKATGIEDVKKLRKKWEQESPFHSGEELTASSTENQAKFAAVGNNVADQTGTEFVNPGPKKLSRLMEKHWLLAKIDRGKAPQTITDAVRGGFKVQDPAHADAVVNELAKHYELADEGWAKTDSGYFDRKVLARMPDKQIAEVQFWHPAMLDAKEGSGQGHKLYEAQQALEKVSVSHPLIAPIKEAQKALYGGALGKMPGAWQAVHMPSL